MTTLKKWRGLKALVQDSVDSVSRAVERVQKDTTKRWFDLAEAVPPVASPVRVVRTIHDTSVTGVHEIIRFANHVAGAVADGVIDALENIEAKKAGSAQADAKAGAAAAADVGAEPAARRPSEAPMPNQPKGEPGPGDAPPA